MCGLLGDDSVDFRSEIPSGYNKIDRRINFCYVFWVPGALNSSAFAIAKMRKRPKLRCIFKTSVIDRDKLGQQSLPRLISRAVWRCKHSSQRFLPSHLLPISKPRRENHLHRSRRVILTDRNHLHSALPIGISPHVR